MQYWLVIYFLMDVSELDETAGDADSDAGSRSEMWEDYSTALSLCPSVVQLIRLMWCVDHQQWKEAKTLLLGSKIVKRDCLPNQHRSVLEKLFAEKQSSLAQLYFDRFVGRAHASPSDTKETLLYLSILLANGQAAVSRLELALDIVRRSCGAQPAAVRQIWAQVCTRCQELRCIPLLFQLGLEPQEEAHVVRFLREQMEEELLVGIYLQRGDFMAARQLTQTVHESRRQALESLIELHLQVSSFCLNPNP